MVLSNDSTKPTEPKYWIDIPLHHPKESGRLPGNGWGITIIADLTEALIITLQWILHSNGRLQPQSKSDFVYFGIVQKWEVFRLHSEVMIFRFQRIVFGLKKSVFIK